MKVRPTDPNATLEIALDGRSVLASRSEPAEVPTELGERLIEQPTWERVGASQPTINEVLAEVGDDKDKASEALAEERARGTEARATLVKRLETIIEESD